jgi:NADPH:quinone reductase-like Zn-dependent oxidoreductase
MKAACLMSKGGAEGLELREIPAPQPKAGEVLVRVHATAITPTELMWSPTFYTPSGEPRPFPIVLSHEFSGVVESFGADVAGFKVGDPVYGINDWFANGAQAEFVVVSASQLAPKPSSLDHVHASAVPISALTAWQGIAERAGVQAGQRVLIHGGSGAVGLFAVQLAKSRGAHVTTTASAGNAAFVRSLGADEVIDHRATRFEDVVRDVDVVFDTVGGGTLARSWDVLADGGKLVTIATQGESPTDQRTRDAFLLVRADGPQLAELGKLVDAGRLRVFVEAAFPLAQVREAYILAQQRGLRGKVALTLVE